MFKTHYSSSSRPAISLCAQITRPSMKNAPGDNTNNPIFSYPALINQSASRSIENNIYPYNIISKVLPLLYPPYHHPPVPPTSFDPLPFGQSLSLLSSLPLYLLQLLAFPLSLYLINPVEQPTHLPYLSHSLLHCYTIRSKTYFPLLSKALP